MKDYFCPETPGAPDAPLPEAFEFRPLGRGCQDIGEIARAAVAAGAQWLVVEQDFPTESPVQDADVSIRRLRALNAWQNPRGFFDAEKERARERLKASKNVAIFSMRKENLRAPEILRWIYGWRSSKYFFAAF